MEMRRTDGEKIVLRANIIGEFEKNENLVRIRGYLIDITEAKKTEEEVRKLSRSVEQNPASVMITDFDGEIEYVDDCVGAILDTLSETGHDEDTIVVLFSDHGEEFWDHGRWYHGYSAYPELIDMVFAVRDPSIKNQLRV